MGLVERVQKLATIEPINQMRGFHYCELCDQEEIVIASAGRRRLLGSAEIWVTGPDGVVYAAPDLVIHYIREHEYLPPTQFNGMAQDLPAVTWAARSRENHSASRVMNRRRCRLVGVVAACLTMIDSQGIGTGEAPTWPLVERNCRRKSGLNR